MSPFMLSDNSSNVLASARKLLFFKTLKFKFCGFELLLLNFDLRNENRKLKVKNRKLKKDVKKAKKLNKSIINSNSWKLTKPLRALKRWHDA